MRPPRNVSFFSGAKPPQKGRLPSLALPVLRQRAPLSGNESRLGTFWPDVGDVAAERMGDRNQR
jgi:hypothetical protein